MTTVSLIVPVYNTEHYLSKTIESIRAQTYSELEIILVDDGSTDSSGDVCDKYAAADSRIRVVHQDNAGLKCARLAGIEASTGGYIAFSDSDDWVEPDYIELLVKDALEQDADITVGVYSTDTEDQIINYFTMGEKQLFSRPDAMLEMFRNQLFNWSMCNKLYKRELFEEINAGLHPHESYGEDTYFNYLLFSKAQTVFYNASTAYHYVQRSDSMMRQAFDKRMFVYIEQWCQIYDDCMAKGDADIAEAVLNIMADTGITHVVQGFNTYGRTDQDTHEALEKVRTRLKKEPLNHPLYKQLKWYLRTPEEQEAFLEERSTMLESHLGAITRVFLYGAGRIASEVATFLEEKAIDYNVIVSASKPDEVFRGKKVHSISDYELNNSDLIILALSERNMNQVVDSLPSCKVLDFGKYSYYY